MQNLDQLRAAHALIAAALPGPKPNTKLIDKSSVAKLPGMILTNGLLATLAFACEAEKPKRAAMNAASDSLAKHLAATIPELAGSTSGPALGTNLAKGTDLTLQRATTEALAYLSYLKRFAEKKDKSENNE